MGVPVCGTLAVVGSDAEEDRLMRDEWYSGQAWLRFEGVGDKNQELVLIISCVMLVDDGW